MLRTALLCILIGASVAPEVAASELFDAARLAPDDVTTYIHVEDAALLRRDLTRRPIMRWAQSVMHAGQLDESWTQLADAAGVSGEELFDVCFGQEATLMARTEDGETYEWVTVTRVPSRWAEQLLEHLRAVRKGPLDGIPLADLPEHGLLIARRDDHLIIGSRDRPKLFKQVISAHPRAKTLADHPGIARGRTLGDGCAAVFIRHEPPMGGWSVVVADASDGRLRMRHDAHFDNPPFQRSATELEWSMAPLQAFEQRMLAAVIEPMDVGGGPMQAFIEARLAQPLLNEELHTNLGQHRIFAIGEVEGRREADVDLLLPTLAVCIQLQDAETAERALDEKVLSLARRLNEFMVGDVKIDVPRRRTLVPNQARQIDLTPLLKRIGGGLPVIESISLNWIVIECPHGPYAVIATHPQQLREAVAALQTEVEGDVVGGWSQCGTANGQRLGLHLRSYADQAGILGEPGQEELFAATLCLVSELAEGVQRCRWRLSRPEHKTMTLEVELILTPPESAE